MGRGQVMWRSEREGSQQSVREVKRGDLRDQREQFSVRGTWQKVDVKE